MFAKRIHRRAATAGLMAAMSLLFITTNTITAETDGSGHADASLEQLSWLVGRWEGTAFGGLCEEVWHPPFGGCMTGTFTLVVDGTVKFHEFATITMGSDGPELRLKHFNADMTGWEDKDVHVTFPFLGMGDGELQLDGLTYRRMENDSLEIVVVLGNPEGGTERVTIVMTRAPEHIGRATETGSSAMEFSQIRLLVRSFRDMFHFYRDTLGLEVAWGDADNVYAQFRAGSKSDIAMFDASLMDAVVGSEGSSQVDNRRGNFLIVLQVEDVDETVAALKAKNVQMVTAPTDRADWGIRTAHLRDPEGNLIEVMTPLGG